MTAQRLGTVTYSGEFIQLIHVRHNNWCVVSTVGCGSGIVRIHDSLYKTVSKETVQLIASMVHATSSELKIVRGSGHKVYI